MTARAHTTVIPAERSEGRDPGQHDGWLPHWALGPGSRAGTSTEPTNRDIGPRLAGMTIGMRAAGGTGCLPSGTTEVRASGTTEVKR